MDDDTALIRRDPRPMIVWATPLVQTLWLGDIFMERVAQRMHRWRMKQQRVRERRALGSAAGRDGA